MKKLFTVLFLLIGLVSFSQSIGYFRYDSTRLEKVGGNNELILLNGTRSVTNGVLTNIGNGRTAFVTPTAGVAGGNLGAGYRYYVPSSQGIKTTIADNGLTLDSATSNILNYKLGGTLTANTTIAQGSNSMNFTGTGITTIGTAITSSTGRLQVQNPTAGGQNAAFGPLLSNNVYLANYAIDSVTAATVAAIKSTGIYTRRKIVVNSGSFSRGGLWNMASDLMFETRDSFRLDPVGSDLLAGIIARILMQPAGTGRSVVQNGTFKDDYVAAIVAAIQNDNTNTSNWILNRGYKASLVTHFINGGSKDTTENYAGVFSTALNSGRILRANQFYAGPIGNVDSLFAFYAPYDAFNYFYGSLRVGGDVSGNSYAASPSAMLEVASTTKGVLVPRMTGTQQNAISSPATSLLIYNTDSSAFTYYNGSAWRALAAGSGGGGGGTVSNVASGYGLAGGPITTTGTLLFDSATVFTQLRSQMWTLGGNAATAGSQTGSFLGTTNSVQLRIRTNNTERAVWDSAIAQLRIGGATRNTTDGLIIMAPGNGNGDGIKIYAQGGVTPLTIGQAQITRGGGYDLNTSSGSISLSPSVGVYVGTSFTAATALLHIKASTTAASSGQIKLNEGSRLTTPEDGNINYVSNNLEFTETSTVYILAKTLKATATLDFPTIAVGDNEDLTITVTGAATGDPVALAIPTSEAADGTCVTAWVSGANTVTVRFNNYRNTSFDPNSASYTVAVLHY